jgi:hypothetical protein
MKNLRPASFLTQDSKNKLEALPLSQLTWWHLLKGLRKNTETQAAGALVAD